MTCAHTMQGHTQSHRCGVHGQEGRGAAAWHTVTCASVHMCTASPACQRVHAACVVVAGDSPPLTHMHTHMKERARVLPPCRLCRHAPATCVWWRVTLCTHTCTHSHSLTLTLQVVPARTCNLCVVAGGAVAPRGVAKSVPAVTEEWLLKVAETHEQQDVKAFDARKQGGAAV